jgi:ankyrin repeat protein
LFTESPAKEILWASENGKLSEVERLILGDPMLIHAKDKDGYTPLHRACYNDHEHIVDVSLCALACLETLAIRGHLVKSRRLGLMQCFVG